LAFFYFSSGLFLFADFLCYITANATMHSM
jgi:hypothetical protein